MFPWQLTFTLKSISCDYSPSLYITPSFIYLPFPFAQVLPSWVQSFSLSLYITLLYPLYMIILFLSNSFTCFNCTFLSPAQVPSPPSVMCLLSPFPFLFYIFSLFSHPLLLYAYSLYISPLLSFTGALRKEKKKTLPFTRKFNWEFHSIIA